MITVYNDLTNAMEEFCPLQPGKITFYVCGPTVYDSPHLGHAMSAVVFDVIRRYLEYRGFDVKYAMNYTDIDDKMINRANDRGIPVSQLANQYIAEYEAMEDALSIKKPSIRPRATEEIAEMVEMIRTLEDKGFTYTSQGSVYFDTSKMEGYKNLFRKKEVADVQEEESYSQSEYLEEKRNLEDFVLWKAEKPGEPSWDSPWGKGRPGWHIECSVMSSKYLGKTIDFHGGGKDLKQPHHQNEIAQSECANGQKFVNYWIHNGFLNIDNTKMSKSLGNFIPLMDMLQKFSGTFLRYYFATSYYRSPINFSMEKLDEAQKNLERIQRFYSQLKASIKDPLQDQAISQGQTDEFRQTFDQYRNSFLDAMDNDFNAAKAMGYLFSLINYFQKQLNVGQKIPTFIQDELVSFIEGVDTFFDFITIKESEQNMGDSEWKGRFIALVEKLLELRKEVKGEKNYGLADRLRALLSEADVKVNDVGKDYTYEI